MATSRNADLGLVILRVGIGLYFFAYGLAKLFGGAERWEQVGAAMANLGLDFWPLAWGFAASLTELCGGVLVALGLLFRPTCGLLAFTMVVATIAKGVSAAGEDGAGPFSVFLGMGHPASMLILFVSLCLIGPGAYALDRRYRMTLTSRVKRSSTSGVGSGT